MFIKEAMQGDLAEMNTGKLAQGVRRQTRERAIVEQVSSTRTLLDPRAFHLAIQAGRALGWQRLVPLLLIGILGVQWARETHKDAGRSDGA